MGRFVSFVPQTPLSWPMSVLLPRLQHLLSLVPLSRSITALDDLDTPAADIAFLRGVYETERQTDFDRANPVAYAARTGTPYRDLDDED
jgi:hypothetical protein